MNAVLITGASGFLGRHVVRALKRRGKTVVAASRRTITGTDGVYLDLTEPDSITTAFSQCKPDCVIHCAAYGVDYREQDPDRAIAVNVVGSYKLLCAAADAGARRFVHIGSCFEYGDKPEHIRETDPLEPTAIYGSTKAAASVLMIERAHSLGIDFMVVRPFGFWGPGEPAHRLVPQIIRACLCGQPLDLTGCELMRDYSYVEDMAEWVVGLAVHSQTFDVAALNIGSGAPILLRNFVLSIASYFGKAELMRFDAKPYRPTEMRRVCADTTRMRRLIDPGVPTELAVGLDRMVREIGADYVG